MPRCKETFVILDRSIFSANGARYALTFINRKKENEFLIRFW